uniref:Scaffold protein Tuba n=1 Tax=Meloidogyne incognita TaxID=6306 RepID=A0A914L8S7_MELIC
MSKDRFYCKALYDFRSEYPGELNFTANELIYIDKKINEEWLSGESQKSGQKGIFPISFVEIIHNEQEMSKFSASHSDPILSSEGFSNSIGVATVLYDFEGRFEDELNVKAGDSIQVSSVIDNEWAKCRDPTTGQSGIVPQSFLHIFLDGLESPKEISQISSKNGENSFNSIASSYDQPPSNSSTSISSMSNFASSNVCDWPNPLETSNVSINNSNVFNNVFSLPPPRPPPPNPILRQTSFTESTAELSSRNSQYIQNDRRKSLTFIKEDEQQYQSLIKAAGNAFTNPLIPQLETINGSDTKSKVLLDFLNTEQIYLFDLQTWQNCVNESGNLTKSEKEALTKEYPALEKLCQSIISALTSQKDLPADVQSLGSKFMELKSQFYSTFSKHFRSVENINLMIENENNSNFNRAIQLCVQLMRERGSNIFDVSTAISRPIQRCLKYPLYIGELLKNTPINHPDHPKLMEALRQLGDLASRMNESKRRKELVRKYNTQEQLTISERLARINMHSLLKKSNRLKYRINRTMGFGTIRDSEFDYLVQLLEDAERRLCKFLYCAQLYRKHIALAARKHEDSYKGFCQVQDEEVVKEYAKMLRRVDEICGKYLRDFDQKILVEGKRLVRSELTKLIHKRFDKLADFEVVKASNKNQDEVEKCRNEFEALNNQIKGQLPSVISTINTQVLQLVQKVNEIHQQFLTQMDEWYYKERPVKVLHYAFTVPPFITNLSVSVKNVLLEMDKIAAYLYQRQTIAENAPFLARRKSLRLSFRAKSANQKKISSHQQQISSLNSRLRQQSEKERDALFKICHTQNQSGQLRKVTRDWQNSEMVLKQGDLVLVKEHRQDGFCLCDNAVSNGLVPVDVLIPLNMCNESTNQALMEDEIQTKINKPKEELNEFTSQQQKQQQTSWIDLLKTDFSVSQSNSPNILYPSKQQLNKTQKSNLGGEKDLIDLEDNLIDFDSPPKVPSLIEPTIIDLSGQNKRKTSERQKQQTINSNVQNEQFCQNNLSELFDFLSCEQSLPSLNSHNKTQFSTTFGSSNQQDPVALFDSHTNPKADFNVNIQPNRIAPPPPTQKKRGRTPNNNNSDSQQNSPTNSIIFTQYYSIPPPSTDFSQSNNQDSLPHNGNFAICLYDFEPSVGNESRQITVKRGETVEVIRRHDFAGNTQWWLVKRLRDSAQGFVPANYLNIEEHT